MRSNQLEKRVMSSLLHITNGDSFTTVLQKLDIPGEIITWREMLCEGPTTTDVGSESFWKTRFGFLNKKYRFTKSRFIDYTLKEYRNLCNQSKKNEVVLWFEYDLFCQINMLALLSWLKKHRSKAEISLVCSGKMKNGSKHYGLCELNKEDLLELYTHRVRLNLDDLEYADYVWQLYCGDSPLKLENLVQPKNIQFEYLSGSIEAHLKRFPTIKNGLNLLENRALAVAAAQKFNSKDSLVGAMLSEQEPYGFGDLQYFRMIDDLKPLFTSFNPVRLSKKGNEVLTQNYNYYSTIKDEKVYMGGSRKYDYLYNEEAGKLLKL